MIAAAVVHLRQAVFAGEKRALGVDRQRAVEHVFRIVGERRSLARIAGVGEQHVDLAPLRTVAAI